MRRDAEVSVLEVALERGAVAAQPRPGAGAGPPAEAPRPPMRPPQARPLGAPDRRAGAAGPAASRRGRARWCACPGGERRRARSPAPWPSGSPSSAPPPGGSRPRGRTAGAPRPCGRASAPPPPSDESRALRSPSRARRDLMPGVVNHRPAWNTCLRASICLFRASSSADAGAVAEDLGALMKLLLTGTNSEFFATVERLGLSFTQVKTLGVLREAEAPLTVKALSDLLGLSLPAVSRAVETLVRRGEVQARGGSPGPPLQERGPHGEGPQNVRPARRAPHGRHQELRGGDGSLRARGPGRRAPTDRRKDPSVTAPHTPQRGQPALVDARAPCASPCS